MMQDLDELPLEQWAEQLKQARTEAGIEINGITQALMLSSAQLRGIENGSASAFHGPGYYLRAVEKYAQHLNVTLDPPVTELRLTDSQIALNRVKSSPSAAKLAKRESRTLGADAIPRSSNPSRIGVWLAALLLVLVGTGAWLALEEGWPGGNAENVATQHGNEAMDTTQTEPPALASTVQAAPPPASKADISVQATPSAPTTVTLGPNTVQTSTQTGIGTGIETNPKPSAQDNADTSASGTTTLEPTPPAQTQASSEVNPDLEVKPELEVNPELEFAPKFEPPAPPQAVIPATADAIEAQFTADCWVEIQFADGRVEQGIYQPGQTLTVPVEEITRLTFGNAQAVSATRSGQQFDVQAFTRSGNNVARISSQDLQSP